MIRVDEQTIALGLRLAAQDAESTTPVRVTLTDAFVLATGFQVAWHSASEVRRGMPLIPADDRIMCLVRSVLTKYEWDDLLDS